MTDSEKIEFIQTAISKLMKKTLKLTPSDSLVDLSLDSLDIVELQMYYEETTGHEIESDNVIVTVGDLMAVMK
jgi:acyl carrier protein